MFSSNRFLITPIKQNMINFFCISQNLLSNDCSSGKPWRSHWQHWKSYAFAPFWQSCRCCFLFFADEILEHCFFSSKELLVIVITFRCYVCITVYVMSIFMLMLSCQHNFQSIIIYYYCLLLLLLMYTHISFCLKHLPNDEPGNR